MAGLPRYRVAAVVVLGWAEDWDVAVAEGTLRLQAFPVLLLQLLQVFLALTFLPRLLQRLQVLSA